MSFSRKFILGRSYYGNLVILIGLLVLFPIIVLPFYPEDIEFAPAFIIPSLLSILLGIIVCVIAPKKRKNASEWQSPMQKGSLPVLFAWCYGIFLGAFPFFISQKLGFLQSLFESTSGWTTTGLTIVNISDLPHILLFHRSFMQYSGGLGFIMMIVMFIQGKESMNLYSAEGHPDKLMPNLKQTAQTIFLLYNGFLAVGTLLYVIFGMNLFDALCHTMSALSTAGFSTRAENIEYYHSRAIEIVTILLMLVGGTNFSVLLLLVKGKIRQLFRVTEVRFLIGLLLVSVTLTAISLVKYMGMDIGSAIHNALFCIVTTYSTTGYSTMNYSQWPPFALGVIIVLMIIGGGTGSTAGGIKLSRTSLLLKITLNNFRRRLSPARNISSLHYYKANGKVPVSDSLIMETTAFVTCYFFIIIVGTLLITLTANCSLIDAIYEFTSAFGTVGISNGLTSAGSSVGTLIVLMIGMLLGRLEIYIVLIGIYSEFRRTGQRIEKGIDKLTLPFVHRRKIDKKRAARLRSSKT